MVMQRQVPVRSVARMGGEANGEDTGGGRPDDAFLSVLSGQKRSTVAARDEIEHKGESDQTSDPDAGPEADGMDMAFSATTTQSDDMRSLLESLMSGAAFSGETPAAVNGVEATNLRAPAGDNPIEADASADDRVEDMPTVLPGAAQMPQPQPLLDAADMAEAELSGNVDTEAKPVAAGPLRQSTSGETQLTPAETRIQLPPAETQTQLTPAETRIQLTPAETRIQLMPTESQIQLTPADAPTLLSPDETSLRPDSGKDTTQPDPIKFTERMDTLNPRPQPDKPASQPNAAMSASADAPAVATQVMTASAPVAVAAQVGAIRSGQVGQMPQGPQAQAKPQPASVATEQAGASAEGKETIRTLGMVDEVPSAPGSSGMGPDERFADAAARKSAAANRPAEEPLNPKTGSVEVIESRRFMPAQPLTGNAQMLTKSLIESGDAALAAQRTAPAQATAAQPQSGQMLHTLKLQLNPVSLGSVTAVLKLTGEELSVSIQVETAEAYRQLSDDNQSILKAMRAQGYAVEQITVQHVATGDRAGNQAQQQGFQGAFQGPGSGDAQSSGRGNNGGSTGQQGANQHGGQGREQNTNPGSGSGRSDGVYL